MGSRPSSILLQAIAHGIQAPNPHNTQAWRFEPLSGSEALLFIDERRLLPATDPPARQIHIGAGCCIEMLAAGMSLHGYETEVEYLPQGAHGLEETGRKPVVRLALVSNPSAPRDELAEFIQLRQTNRKPYRGPLLSPDDAAAIRSDLESDDFELSIIRQPEEMRPLFDIFTAHGRSRRRHHICMRRPGSGFASTRSSGGRSATA